MRSSPARIVVALVAVLALAFTGVADGKLHLTRHKAYKANLAHAKGFCKYVNGQASPTIGTCTKATGKCLKRLNRTAFSCQERFVLVKEETDRYACTDRTKVTLRRGVGVRATYVSGTTKCSDLPDQS
jgi:hypothetical protein